MSSPNQLNVPEAFTAAFPNHVLTPAEFHILWERAGSQSRPDYPMLDNLRWQVAKFAMLLVDEAQSRVPRPDPVIVSKAGDSYPEPVHEFVEGQWWVKELDELVKGVNITMDQKRAVAVVHHLLHSIQVHAQPKKDV